MEQNKLFEEEEKEIKSKFLDGIYYCKLNNVYVKFNFKNNYFDNREIPNIVGTPHIEVYSLREKEEIVVTETGYHSYFWGDGACGEGFDSVIEMIEDVVQGTFNYSWKETKHKRGEKQPSLNFEWIKGKTEKELLVEANKIPLFNSKQFTLTELEGGVK